MQINGCFPDETIIDIFSRLPFKSLLRFKSASKPLLYLIEQDSSFIEKARDKSPYLWLFPDDEKIRVYSVDAAGLASHYHTYKFVLEVDDVKYCNGLVGYSHPRFGLCLLNLTNEECICLDATCDHYEICFDPSSARCKVLGWTESEGSGICDFEILTLEKDFSWREMRNTLGTKYLSNWEATTVNGKVFWTLEDEKQIISFNSNDEEFRVIDFPKQLNLEVCCYTFFDFEGSLSLVEQPRREQPVFNLWMLKDSGTSNHWIMMKRNITLPIQGTSLHHYYQSIGSWWTLVESQFSFESGEIRIIPRLPDDEVQHLVDTYVYFYSFLNGQFKIIKPRGLPKYFKVKQFLENDVRLKDFL